MNDCDQDDLECLEDFTTSASTTSITSSSTSFITSSSFSFGEPSSTVLAANKPDIISDFHEAQLAKQRPNLNNLGGKGREVLPAKEDGEQAGSVQDKYDQGQVIDSGSAGLGDSIDESTTTGLSRVEAGILSACGILVVAGIAVGIFVWKNTTKRRNSRNQDMSITDLEYNHDLDMNGSDPMAVKNSINAQMPKAIIESSIESEKERQNDDIQSVKSTNSERLSIIQKQLQQGLHEEERLQLQQLKQQNIMDLSLPAFEPDEDDFFTMWERHNSKDSFKNKPTQQEISEQHLGTKDETIKTFQLPKFEHSLFTSEENDVMDPVSKKAAAIEIVHDESQEADINQPNSIATSNVGLPPSTYHTPEVGKENEMSDLSPGLQANTVSRPSILDPAHDSTAVTYPLQKFLHIPTQSFKSPIQIPVELGDHDQEEEDTIDEQSRQQQISLDKHDAFGVIEDNEKTVASSSMQDLNQQLNKIFRQPDPHFKSADEKDSVSSSTKEPTATSPQNAMVDIDLTNNKLKERSPLSVIQIKEDETEHGKQPFLSPLDLPDDQYVPMRDAAGPPLVSRAQVLADPIRRLGEDEIALWEQNCRKKELKRLSYEMWDEQMLREGIEENDRKHIAPYYGEQVVESQEEEAIPR